MIFGYKDVGRAAYFRLWIFVLSLSRNSHAPSSWASLLAPEPPKCRLAAVARLSDCEVPTTVWFFPCTGMDYWIGVLVVLPVVDLCTSSIQRHPGPQGGGIARCSDATYSF